MKFVDREDGATIEPMTEIGPYLQYDARSGVYIYDAAAPVPRPPLLRTTKVTTTTNAAVDAGIDAPSAPLRILVYEYRHPPAAGARDPAPLRRRQLDGGRNASADADAADPDAGEENRNLI